MALKVRQVHSGLGDQPLEFLFRFREGLACPGAKVLHEGLHVIDHSMNELCPNSAVLPPGGAAALDYLQRQPIRVASEGVSYKFSGVSPLRVRFEVTPELIVRAPTRWRATNKRSQTLYDIHAPRVFAVCLRMSRRWSQASELLTAFCPAWGEARIVSRRKCLRDLAQQNWRSLVVRSM